METKRKGSAPTKKGPSEADLQGVRDRAKAAGKKPNEEFVRRTAEKNYQYQSAQRASAGRTSRDATARTGGVGSARTTSVTRVTTGTPKAGATRITATRPAAGKPVRKGPRPTRSPGKPTGRKY